MAFDISTAKPVNSGFDISTAQPEAITQQFSNEDVPTDINLAAEQARVDARTEPSTLDKMVGAAEAGTALFTGATTGALGFAIGSVEGAVGELLGNIERGQGVEVAKRYAEALTNTPETPEGMALVKLVGEKLGVLPPVLGTTPAPIIGAATSPIRTARINASNVKQNIGDLMLPVGMAKTAHRKGTLSSFRLPKDNGLKRKIIAEQTLADNPNIAAVTKMVNESGEIVTNQNSKTALKQLSADLGKDRATEVVSVFENMKSGSKKDLGDMLNIVQDGRDKPLSVYDKRPSDILGRAYAQRGQDVARINEAAGKRIGAIAKNELSKSNFDISSASNNFFESMSDLGVHAIKNDDGSVKMDFSSSKFIGGNESLINRLANFVVKGEMNGLDAHTTKQFARELVDFGTGTESAIAAGSQKPIKNLASDINAVLVNSNDRYKRANKKFSDSIDIKTRFDKLANTVDLGGDLANQSLANKAKRIASNAESRGPIKQLLTDAESFLSDNGVNYKNDINSLLFATKTLEDAFKIVPESSFQGGIQRGAVNVAAGMSPELAVGRSLMDKVFNLDKPDFNKKMKTFRLLTEQGKK